MKPLLRSLGNPFSAGGRIGRLTYALGLAGLAAGTLSLILIFEPAGILTLVAGAYVFICLAARRLHDLNLNGWLASIPFVVTGGVGVLSVYLTFVTSAFCQGYCANANPSDIALQGMLRDQSGAWLEGIFLVFVALLCVLPGRSAPDLRRGP